MAVPDAWRRPPGAPDRLMAKLVLKVLFLAAVVCTGGLKAATPGAPETVGIGAGVAGVFAAAEASVLPEEAATQPLGDWACASGAGEDEGKSHGKQCVADALPGSHGLLQGSAAPEWLLSTRHDALRDHAGRRPGLARGPPAA